MKGRNMPKTTTPSLKFTQRGGAVLARHTTYETTLSKCGVRPEVLRKAIADKSTGNVRVEVRCMKRKYTVQGVLEIFEVKVLTTVNPFALAATLGGNFNHVQYANVR